MNEIPSFLRQSYINGEISKETFDKLTMKLAFPKSKDSEESASLKERRIALIGTPDVVSDEVKAALEIEKIKGFPPIEKKDLWKIKTLLCGVTKDSPLFYGLMKIGKEEGFKVEAHPVEAEWVRDSSFPFLSGVFLLPVSIPLLQMSQVIGEAKQLCKIPKELKKWDHVGFLGVVADVNLNQSYHEYCATEKASICVSEADIYFEGGNILKAEDLKGETCYLVGAYNVVISEALKKGAKDRFANSLLGKVLFPGLEKKEQLGFHLDIYMLPIMGGKVLIHDDYESVKLLERLIKNPEVSERSKKQFTRYLKDARELATLQKESLSRLKEELRQEGFEPISISGNYSIDGKVKINFLNSVHGYGEAETSFVATLGYGTQGEKYLRGYFTSILQQHGIDHVYYLPTSTAADFLDRFGGLHCKTIEL